MVGSDGDDSWLGLSLVFSEEGNCDHGEGVGTNELSGFTRFGRVKLVAKVTGCVSSSPLLDAA